MQVSKKYDTSALPINENLKKFAPSYVPEEFAQEEKKFLNPFFSNIDQPAFVIKHLPEEVIGALSSRYSRAKKSLRRMFLDEYVAPILRPEEQVDWGEISDKEKKSRQETKKKLLELIEFLNLHGGIDAVTNVQRARKFFDKWLAEYGDDSIAELGTIHICLEGISNVALQEIVEKRVGISLLEKSTRYVSFADREADGQYKYVVPGEIIGTPLEKEYRKTMDLLFGAYVNLSQPYFEYISQRYPQGDDETPVSFKNSRGAKRFDDIRDLLPFSTKTNVAISGNGRVFEDLINRLLSSPLGEIRWWGVEICREVEKVVPSFVVRPQNVRGAEVQFYKKNLRSIRESLAKKNLKSIKKPKFDKWVRLVDFDREADINIISAFLFTSGMDLSLKEIVKTVSKLGIKKRAEILKQIFEERKFGKKEFVRQYDRFRKVPRAFEDAQYLFEIWARGGDYRDLHRHRMNTQEHQRFTTFWGYDLEKEVTESPFATEFRSAMKASEELFKKMYRISPDLAQYAVAFGFVQHWYMNLTAREIFWMVELRTGPQGRPLYRKVCQQIAQLATDATPTVFAALLTDFNDYSLARRESEKKIEEKKKKLGM